MRLFKLIFLNNGPSCPDSGARWANSIKVIQSHSVGGNIVSALNRWVHHTPGIHLAPTSPTYIHVGRGGSPVDSSPFVRRVAGSNPTLTEIQVIWNTYLYLKSVASPGNEARGTT